MKSSPRERPLSARRKSISMARPVNECSEAKEDNDYEDGRITVSVRVRPLNTSESILGTGSCIAALSAYNTLYVVPPSVVQQNVDDLIARDPQLRGISHHRFTFDHVYPTDATQEQVYAQIGHPVLQSSFRGYHTCIFAYGQTGSGKSYCMMGADGGLAIDDNPGIIPRLCKEMFAEMSAREAAAVEVGHEQVEFSVYVSYLEIYRERVRSLLDESTDAKVAGVTEPSTPRSTVNALRRTVGLLQSVTSPGGNLRVREHPTLGVYVEGLAEIPVTSVEQVLRLMVRGNHRRHTASTKLNDTSSRSHAIFTIQLLQKRLHIVSPSTSETIFGSADKTSTSDARQGQDATLNATASTAGDVAAVIAASATANVTLTTQLGAKINLVDLAGSERAKATGAEGDTLKEGAQINRSLTTLGIVINALAAQSMSGTANASQGGGKRHIPYRDSTLTFLLKESLGGNSKTFMIATVSPSSDNYDESVSTLRYADRAKAIVMRASINETAGDKRIRELEREVMRLRERIKALLEAEASRASATHSDTASLSLSLSPSQPISLTPILLADSQSMPQGDCVDVSGERGDFSDSGSGTSNLGSIAAVAADIAESPTRSEIGNEARQREDSPLKDVAANKREVDNSTPPASLPAALPIEPREVLIGALQGELRRAEEMIRQLSVTQAERDAHIAKLVEEQQKERAEMRAAAEAAAAAREEAEKAAAAATAKAAVMVRASTSPVQMSTMRLNCDEPYLLNMDGAGDWVVAILGPVQTHVGVFYSGERNCRATAKGENLIHEKDSQPAGEKTARRSPAESFDSSLSLPFSDGRASHAETADEANDNDCNSPTSASSSSSKTRYVKLPAEFSNGIGGPHFILERANALPTVTTPATMTTTGGSVVTLRGCGNYETLILRPLYPAPFIVKGASDSLELKSGDLLDIGSEHIQLKYIDPSAPPVTARGRRTVPLAMSGAFLPTGGNATAVLGEATVIERVMSPLTASPASQGNRPEAQVCNLSMLPLSSFSIKKADQDRASNTVCTAEAKSEERMRTRSPSKNDSQSSKGDAEQRQETEPESESDSDDSQMDSPADQPGGKAIKQPERPLVPVLALGKELPIIHGNCQSLQHADPAVDGKAAADSNSCNCNVTTPSTSEGKENAHVSASVSSSTEWASSNLNPHTRTAGNPNEALIFSAKTTTITTACETAVALKSRKPSKRAEAIAAASVSIAPHAALGSLELQSVLANASSSTYRSEPHAKFVGRYNVVLVGPSGGGKTSLVNNLMAPDKAWLRSAFSALTSSTRSSSGDNRDGAASSDHPTIGIESRILTSGGSIPMSLYTHELGGTPCFSPLLDQLPSHRVTYLLCFPLQGLTSLITLRGVVEDILCRTDNHTVSLVLVGTHADRNAAGKHDGSFLSRLPAARQEMLHRQLEEVEQQVVSLIQMLQPYPQLRPTVVGRFAVDNVHRHIYSTGYQTVEGFPQLLQWLADAARERCRGDADFANGLVPTRCLELGRQVSLLRQRGKWCVSLRDFKSLAEAVSSNYRGDVIGTGTAAAAEAQQPPWTSSQLKPAALARDALRNHVQLLADWGVLMHRYRSLQLRQHIILDVAWLSRLLAALACCPLIAAAESDGLSKKVAAMLVDVVGEEGTTSLTRKEAALRTLLTPEAERVVDMVKVATTDTPHLLRFGVLSIPVLIALLDQHFIRSSSDAAAASSGDGQKDVIGQTCHNSNVEHQHGLLSFEGFLAGGRPSLPPFGGNNSGGSGENGNAGVVTRYAVPPAGVVEFLVLLDLVILGSKLSFSPSLHAGRSQMSSAMRGANCPADAARSLCDTTATAKAVNADNNSENYFGVVSDFSSDSDSDSDSADDFEKESFVLYPLSFRTPASAGVTWLFPCFLSGPFYVFKLNMVPRNFFPKLLCRLATVADKIYLGPVEKKLRGSLTQRWADNTTHTCSAITKRGGSNNTASMSNRRTATISTTASAIATATATDLFDTCFEHRVDSPFVLPSFPPYFTGAASDGRLCRCDGFWFDAAWLVFNNGGNAERGKGNKNSGTHASSVDSCRVLVRLVHHSVFLSFHCHSVTAVPFFNASAAPTASAVHGGGDCVSLAVQDFYEAVLEAVRYVVEEFPGGKCVESMQCCVDSATLLQSDQQHPAMQTDQEAAAQDRYMCFVNINDNINNLERVLSKSGAALRTARTGRRLSTALKAPPVEDEDTYVPLLHHFGDMPPLSTHECIRRWKSEQRLYIAPAVEAHLTTALHALEECYHGDATAECSSMDSCAKLDYLLDVLARVDTI